MASWKTTFFCNTAERKTIFYFYLYWGYFTLQDVKIQYLQSHLAAANGGGRSGLQSVRTLLLLTSTIFSRPHVGKGLSNKFLLPHTYSVASYLLGRFTGGALLIISNHLNWTMWKESSWPPAVPATWYCCVYSVHCLVYSLYYTYYTTAWLFTQR